MVAPTAYLVTRGPVIVSVFALAVVGSSALSDAAVRPARGGESTPIIDFSSSNSRPRAGTTFTGVIANLDPPAGHIVSATCQATLGGHFTGRGDERKLVGGVSIRPVISFYSLFGNGGFQTAASCAWRIPLNAGGKLLSLQPKGCAHLCDAGGFAVRYRLRQADGSLGPLTGANYVIPTWRVRS
jgi:hypothetical protein